MQACRLPLSCTPTYIRTRCDTRSRLTYYASLQSGDHWFTPPQTHAPPPPHTHTCTPPPVCFVLHVPFPLHTPVILLVTVVIVMHRRQKSCQHFLTVSHTHTNDKTQINKLRSKLAHKTSRPSHIRTAVTSWPAYLLTCISASRK